MRAALLLLSVLTVVFSQALDFNPSEARTVGEGFWLPDGDWTADITGRDDLVNSVIELSLGVSDSGYDCYYSVWADETQLSHGTFNNVANNVIPLLTGTVNATAASTLTVRTSGCVLGRYAIPFLFGDATGFNQDGAVELVDIGIGSAATSTFTAENQAGFNQVAYTIPDNYDDWVARLQYVRNIDFDCSFSSQACDGAPNEQFWSTNINNGPINNGAFDFFAPTSSDATNQLVFELSAWHSGPWIVSASLCNSSAPAVDCTVSGAGGWVPTHLHSDNSNGYTGEQNFAAAASGLSYNKYSRAFYEFTTDPNFFAAVLYTANTAAVMFPYAKVWDLSVTDDALYQIIKPAASGDCQAFDYSSESCGSATNGWGQFFIDGAAFYGQNYATESSFFTPTSPVLKNGGTPCTFTSTAWYFCWTSTIPFATVATAETAAVDSLQTTNGAPGTTTGATLVATSTGAGFTDGFFQIYAIDAGIPYLYTVNAAYGSENNAAPGLSTYFHVNAQTGTGASVESASFWDFNIEIPSATQYTRGLGSVVGGHFEVGLDAGWTLELKAQPGYSFGLQPYFFAFALPSTRNLTDGSDICDPATTCSAHGACVNGLCICDPGFTGADCSELVKYCQTGSCLNGGVCSENAARTWDATAQMFKDLITCDCSGTQGNSTGVFLGSWCEIPPPCDQQPCLNNGTCVVNAVTFGWDCDCSGTTSPNSTLPYTGVHCEVSQALPCDDSPCLNGGACTNHGVGAVAYATCDCSGTGGYLGTFCDLPPIDKCDATVCGKYGVCYPSASASSPVPFTKCVCTAGYFGAACDQPPAQCLDKCQNGGECYALGNLADPGTQTYSCICPPPFVGMHCQWNETQWNSAPSSSVGILVLVVALVSALLF